MSIWIKIMGARKPSDLGPDDWKTLRKIARQIFFFDTKDLPEKQLREMLGDPLPSDLQKQQQAISADIDLIMAVTLKYVEACKKYDRQKMTLNMFFDIGQHCGEKSALNHPFLSKYGAGSINEADFYILRQSGAISRGNSLKKDFYAALRRRTKTRKDIDSMFLSEHGMTLDEFQASEAGVREARERIRSALKRKSSKSCNSKGDII